MSDENVEILLRASRTASAGSSVDERASFLSILDMRIGQIWTFRDRRVVRYEGLPSWERALEVAGLAE